MRRIWIKAAALMPLVLLLSGCSLISTPSEFGINALSEASDGFYVYDSEEQIFHSLFDPERDSTNANLAMSAQEGLEVAFLVTEGSLEDIPRLGKGDLLILKSGLEPKEAVPFFPLVESGYTIGMALDTKDNSDAYGIMQRAASVASGSSADNKLSEEIAGADSVRVVSIGGEPIERNLLSGAGTVKGLLKDNIYEVSILTGTTEHRIPVVADTKLFLSDPNTVYSFNESQYTNQGFVVLRFEPNVPKGCYIIDPVSSLGARGGMFYYDPNGEE